jgi:hypothetical protein
VLCLEVKEWQFCIDPGAIKLLILNNNGCYNFGDGVHFSNPS